MAFRPFPIAVLAGAVALAGCLELAPVEPGGSGGFVATGGSNVGGAAGAGGGGGGVCNCPSGGLWTFGWMAVGSGAMAAPCPASAPSRHEGGEGLSDPGCSPCSCGPATGGKCEVRRTRYADTNCKILSQVDTATLTGSGCESFTTTVASVRLQLNATAGKCAPSSTPLPVSFATEGVFCAGGAACDCEPPPAPFTRRCAAHAGGEEVACPPELPVPHSLVVAVKDTRTCTGCACGSPLGQPCLGQSAAACSAAQCAGCFSGSTCGNSVGSVQYAAGTASGAGCPPSGAPVQTGSVSSASVLTLCCEA